MKINKFLLFLIICAGLQSANIFCSEEGIEEVQPTQSWWGQAGGYMSSAAAIAKRRAQEAVSVRPFSQIGIVLMNSHSFLKPFSEIFKGFSIATGLIPIMALSTAVPMLVLSYGIQNIFAYYHNKDIARQVAIDQVKDLISLQLADDMTYPTRSSKLHALLKKNEFLVDTEDVDGIVEQACSELTQQFAAIKPDETQTAKDALVDAQISKVRASFIQYRLKTLDGQIANVSKDIKDILTALEDPVIKAKISVLRRLEQQKIIEQEARDRGTYNVFKRTSSAKFYDMSRRYDPFPKVRRREFEERKKLWEENMQKARETTALWEEEKSKNKE